RVVSGWISDVFSSDQKIPSRNMLAEQFGHAGLQRLCQETGMAELLGEHVSAWHLSGASGLLMIFLVAATIKTLQGSSLVAAITAAGIAQPLLIPLGLDPANARALAALAVGAGAMSVSPHHADPFLLL